MSIKKIVQICLSSVFSFALALPLAGFCAAQSDDCVRSEPGPVFDGKQAGISSYHFSPVSSHEAREQLVLNSGESVEIKHGGCEYMVTTFRIQAKSISSSVKTAREAYLTAAASLRRLQQLKETSGFNLALAAGALDAAVKRNPKIDFGEEIPVEGDGVDFLQAQVQVDAAGWESGVGHIQITLFRGP